MLKNDQGLKQMKVGSNKYAQNVPTPYSMGAEGGYIEYSPRWPHMMCGEVL